MVLRYQSCIVPLVLLALGLRPSTGRISPRFVPGSSSGRLGHAPERASGGRVSQRNALRLGEGGHSCSVTCGGSTRRRLWGLPVARELRGGAIAGGDSSEGEEEHGLEDDEDEDEEFDDEDMTEEDFGEATFIDRFRQDWRKTPIITKTFFKVSVGIALIALFLNGNQWPNFLLLDWQPAIFKLQLWRLFTPFLYLGPVGINFALTVHFAWTYMSQLEKLHYREPHTFVMLLAFGMSSLLLLTLVTGADVNSSFTLGHSLSCFLVMVWSRKYAGTRVNVMDMFELSTELLPYFFVLQTLMMEGVVPWVDISGLAIGYAWETLSMKGLMKAPKPLVNLFRKNAFLRAEYARAGKEWGQDLPVHDDDEEEEEEASQTPDADDKSEKAVEGSEEEEEGEEGQSEGGEGGREGGATGVGERESGGGERRGDSKPPPASGAARGAAGGGSGSEDDVNPAEPEEPSGSEEDAFSSEEEGEEIDGIGEESEGSEAGEGEEQSEEEKFSEESDDLEGFEGGSEGELGTVDELSGSFEDSEED